MTDPSRSITSLSHRSSSALAPTSRSTDSSSVRPRNRQLLSTLDNNDSNDDLTARSRINDLRSSSSTPNRGYGLLSTLSPATSRSGSPNRNANGANLTNFLNDSLSQSWASVQGFASSLISSEDDASRGGRSTARGGSRPGTWGRNTSTSRKGHGVWGPVPPHRTPTMDDVAAGSRAEREAALTAAKRAKVLESHDSVNGGLNVTGNHKRRNSDEIATEQQPPEEYYVYIHKVQPNDTYAGLILRYQCREDAFRKANGLWSRDSVQTRKWLTIPVDACEIRGRPCEPPSWQNGNSVDLLAKTPGIEVETSKSQAPHDDFFIRPTNRDAANTKTGEEDNPWTHIRWVKIDSIPKPVEIGRVARNAMGYFPPRRRKSIRTVSTFSTPRQSFDLSSNPPGSAEGATSRRTSSLSHRPQLSTSLLSSPSRTISEGGGTLPAWMRRPGGVGSMGASARAPGPDKDALTTWTKKHLPGLNLDNLPSMSIMGSETAHFGFKPETGGIVDNHIGEGQDVKSTSQQGSGLDKAAAAVETWLRGALARNPSSNFGAFGNQTNSEGDLIELTDTGSEDGRPAGGPLTSIMESVSIGDMGSSSRSDGNGAVRGRTVGSGAKGNKDN